MVVSTGIRLGRVSVPWIIDTRCRLLHLGVIWPTVGGSEQIGEMVSL